MKISVVTISFNQAKFLRQCIESVLRQNYLNIEYIIVDAGSTDGSREIIESYDNRITKIYEKDNGPADGLNKGFAHATGDIFCYLNSDDAFLDDAFKTVYRFFSQKTDIDVVCGHGYIIDCESKYRRRVYSDTFSITATAYGASVAIQPSTFFRRSTYESVDGFNATNKSNWDGELLIDMALAGARISTLNKYLSCYRVHNESITGTGRLAELHLKHFHRMFEKIMHRPYRSQDDFLYFYYRVIKHIKNPRATFERIFHGPVFGMHK